MTPVTCPFCGTVFASGHWYREHRPIDGHCVDVRTHTEWHTDNTGQWTRCRCNPSHTPGGREPEDP